MLDCRVERFAPGEGKTDRTRPGDFLLIRWRRHPFSAGIHLGQRLHFRGARSTYAYWSHCALVTGKAGELIDVGEDGVTPTPIAKYNGADYAYIHTGLTKQARRFAVDFAKSQVGLKYGWFNLAATALTAGTRLNLSLCDSEICSTLVARALERGPFIFPKPPQSMTPADLAEHFRVTSA